MKIFLPRSYLRKSFTLMEAMLVAVLVSVIVTLAYPNYIKTLEHAKERQMILNLYTIYGAARIYKIKHNAYPPQDLADLAAINQKLGLNIPDSDVTYQYLLFNSGDTYKFRAISPYGWELHFHEGINHIHCSGGMSGGKPCPTCSFESGSGCGVISNY